jgi:hypothetical protein
MGSDIVGCDYPSKMLSHPAPSLHGLDVESDFSNFSSHTRILVHVVRVSTVERNGARGNL